MTRITPLNPIDHGDLRVVTARGRAWGDALNRVPIFPTEFEAAQRDFPILFGRGEDGARQAFALLGLDRDENLFLDGEHWSARHLPALLARGPFSIGVRTNADGTREPMVHVDLDHPRVTADGGEPLFLSHGGTAPYLDRVAEVLRTIHLGHEAQGPMFAAFEAEGLIAPVRLEVQLDDTLRYDLVDFETIGADAFAALDGAALGRLHAQGFLAPALHVLSSLGTMSDLIARKNRRRGGP